MKIRKMELDDLVGASIVHKESFARQKLSLDWMKCLYNSFPRSMCFIAEIDTEVAGYIIWTQKSGFRSEVVMELEQIAVHPDYRNREIAKNLIKCSLPLVRQELSQQDAVLKHVLVTTRADNFAQQLYKQVLGANVEATIKDLYSADEVFMVARQV